MRWEGAGSLQAQSVASSELCIACTHLPTLQPVPLDMCVIHLKAWVLLGAGQVVGEQGGSCSHQVVQQCGHDGGFVVVHMTLHHD